MLLQEEITSQLMNYPQLAAREIVYFQTESADSVFLYLESIGGCMKKISKVLSRYFLCQEKTEVERAAAEEDLDNVFRNFNRIL